MNMINLCFEVRKEAQIRNLDTPVRTVVFFFLVTLFVYSGAYQIFLSQKSKQNRIKAIR